MTPAQLAAANEIETTVSTTWRKILLTVLLWMPGGAATLAELINGVYYRAYQQGRADYLAGVETPR